MRACVHIWAMSIMSMVMEGQKERGTERQTKKLINCEKEREREREKMREAERKREAQRERFT